MAQTKSRTLAAALLGAALLSTSAGAQDTPARDPNFGRDETMAYNTVSGELSSLRATYDVKNTDGSIKAYIEGGPASLTNGTASIALTNTFNGVVLTGTSQEVVDDPQSTPGTQADLVITPAKPTDSQNGLYTASYTVIFDAVPRAAP